MGPYAFVAPFKPGKLEGWKSLTKQLMGEKKTDYVASRKRVESPGKRPFTKERPWAISSLSLSTPLKTPPRPWARCWKARTPLTSGLPNESRISMESPARTWR